jgi:hypothetical protein
VCKGSKIALFNNSRIFNYLKVQLLQATGNVTEIKKGCSVKATWIKNHGLSYPHISAFGTKMATMFPEKTLIILIKIFNKEFCWFRVLLG